eukprot:1547602-Amphidinium_carterae.1
MVAEGSMRKSTTSAQTSSGSYFFDKGYIPDWQPARTTCTTSTGTPFEGNNKSDSTSGSSTTFQVTTYISLEDPKLHEIFDNVKPQTTWRDEIYMYVETTKTRRIDQDDSSTESTSEQITTHNRPTEPRLGGIYQDC